MASELPSPGEPEAILQVGFGSGSMCRKLIGLSLFNVAGIYTNHSKDVGFTLDGIPVMAASELLRIMESGRRVRVILFTSFVDQVKGLFSDFKNVDTLDKEEWLEQLWIMSFKGFSSSGAQRDHLKNTLFCLCVNSGFSPHTLFKLLGIQGGIDPRLVHRATEVLLAPHAEVFEKVSLCPEGEVLPRSFSFRSHIRAVEKFFTKEHQQYHPRRLRSFPGYSLSANNYVVVNRFEVAFYLGRLKVNGLSTAVRNLCLELSCLFPSLGVSKVTFILSRLDTHKSHQLLREYFGAFDFDFEIIVLEDRIPPDQIEAINSLFLSSKQKSAKSYTQIASRAYQKLFPNGSPKIIFNRTGYDPLASFIFAFGRPSEVKAFIWAPNHMIYEWLLRFPKLKWLFAIYHCYDKVIVVSESSMHDNTRLFRWAGLPTDKLLVLRNFLPIKAMPVRSSGHILPNSHPTTFKILWVGRFSSEKNPWLIIEALKRLWFSGMDVSLTLVGNGPLYKPCRAFAFCESEAIPIFFKGESREFYVSDFNHYDIAVNTSVYEGFPNTFYEALATGIPYLAPTTRWGFEAQRLAPQQVLLYSPSAEDLVFSLKKSLVSRRSGLAYRHHIPGVSSLQPFAEHISLFRWAMKC